MQMIKPDVHPAQDCFLINMACISWYTRRQATVESTVFGAEFVAMKQAMEVS